MSRDNEDKRRLMINAGFNVAGHLAALVLAFILAPVMLAGLGSSRYGLWVIVDSVLAYLFLFEGGIGPSLVRYVAKFEELADQRQLNRLFSTTLTLMLGAGLMVLVITLGLALIPAHPLGAPQELVTEARWALLVLGVNLALTLPLGVFPATLDGLGRFPAKVSIRVVCSVGQTIVLALFLRAGQCDLPIAALVISAANLAQLLLHAAAVWWYLPGLRFSVTGVDRATIGLIRGHTISAFLVMIAGRIAFQTDSLVIGGFLTLQAVTYFALGAKLVEYSKGFLRSAFFVMTPAISKWEARGDTTAIRQAYLVGTRLNLYLILPVQVGFWLLGKSFLSLWVGPAYAEEAFPVLVILSLPLGVALAQSVAARVLYGIGQLPGLAAVTIVEALANLGLSLLLVRPFGIVGVAVGTALPSLLCSIAVAWHVNRILSTPTPSYLWQCYRWPTVLCAIPGLIWLGATQAGLGGSWLEFLLLGTVGTLGYAAAAVQVERGWSRLLQDLRSVVRSSPPASGGAAATESHAASEPPESDLPQDRLLQAKTRIVATQHLC